MAVYYQLMSEFNQTNNELKTLYTEQNEVHKFGLSDIDKLVSKYEYDIIEKKLSENKDFQIWGFSFLGVVTQNFGANLISEGDIFHIIAKNGSNYGIKYIGKIVHRVLGSRHDISQEMWDSDKWPIIVLLQGYTIEDTGHLDYMTKRFGYKDKWFRYTKGKCSIISNKSFGGHGSDSENSYYNNILSFAPLSTIPTSTIPTSTIPTSTIPTSTIPTSTIPTSTIPTSTIPTVVVDDTEIDTDDFSIYGTSNLEKKTVLKTERPDQGKFRTDTINYYGEKCALCDIGFTDILEAAHIVPKSNNGSDDPRNGLMLCRNHHGMFDRHYFCLDTNFSVILKPGYTYEQLEIVSTDLNGLRNKPHTKSIEERIKIFENVNNTTTSDLV